MPGEVEKERIQPGLGQFVLLPQNHEARQPSTRVEVATTTEKVIYVMDTARSVEDTVRYIGDQLSRYQAITLKLSDGGHVIIPREQIIKIQITSL